MDIIPTSWATPQQQPLGKLSASFKKRNHAGLAIDATRRPSVDSIHSLPQSPMMDLVISHDVEGNDYMVPMGFNLTHDLGDFLKWHAEHVSGDSKSRRHRSSRASIFLPDPTAADTNTPDDNTPNPASNNDFNLSLAPRPALDTRPTGAADSSRRSSLSTSPARTTADPHAADRFARDRERLLRETRRMASFAGLVGGGNGAGTKRSREVKEKDVEGEVARFGGLDGRHV
ncbi:hypothetical protein C8A05DRAFT_11404 [Staphylotrichum tortipilum]|uniref:Uncharacterized protein n=1 Tax=Staphylotrichum tortipilum TaxID=2831512 RepID=A0AAN6RXZ3_9PEZI|nr:hypothetical protein C8A05DRAFT_11404 [Staphylotrichum longicolle]